MRLVTTTKYSAPILGMDKTIEAIAKAGFDGIDFYAIDMLKDDSPYNADGYMDIARAMKDKADECGIRFLQAHAPCPSSSATDESFNATIREKIARSMEISAFLGAEIIVVHPIKHLKYYMNAEALYEMNMEFYRSLIPYCERYGIRVAAENMYEPDQKRGVCRDSTCASPDEFCKYIDDLGSEWITGCLDLGHAGLCGREAHDILRYMGADRINALHVHDNDYIKDLHTLPYTANMNWDEICRALADIGYRGNFTFEADGFLTRYSPEFIPTALKFMHDTGRLLISRIEAYKGEKAK